MYVIVLNLAIVGGVGVASGAGDGHVGGVDAGGGLEAIHVAHGGIGGIEAGDGSQDGGGENL